MQLLTKVRYHLLSANDELLASAVAASMIVASLALRTASYHVVTSDYTVYYENWLEILRTKPVLTAFAEPFSDYAPLYLYLLKAVAVVPLRGVYGIKIISGSCDVIIALFACAILQRLMPQKANTGQMLLAFSVIFSIPTIIINSSLWGQTDAVYASGIIAAAYYVISGRPRAASIAFALAFSIKLQSIFFLPVLAGFLLAHGQLHQLLWVPFVFVLSLSPAWIGSGELMYWMLIYVTQIGESPALSTNAPSIFSFFNFASGPVTVVLFWVGIALATLSGVAVMALAAWASKKRLRDLLLLNSVLSPAVLVFLLPRMHERYLYLADIFSVILALYNPRCWPAAALIVSASFFAYMPYLSDALPHFKALVIDARLPSVLAISALLLLVYQVLTATGRPHLHSSAWISLPTGTGIARGRTSGTAVSD